MAVWYVSSVAYTNIAQWAASTSYSVGQIVRQLATPTVGNERSFYCSTAGTSGTTEPAWNLSSGSTTTTGTATFVESTGIAALAWTTASARITVVLNKLNNGDTVYVSSDHFETSTGAQYNIASVTNNGSYIICVNRTGSVPPSSADVSTGAVFQTTGNGGLNVQPVGLAYIYGCTFRMGVGANTNQYMALGGNAAQLNLKNCRIEIATTGSNSQINPRIKNEWIDCTVKFSANTQTITGDGPELTWINNQMARAIDPTGSIPNYLFGSGNLYIHGAGLDLSDLGANLYDFTGNPNNYNIDLRNCKISATFAQPSPYLINGGELTYTNCDNGSSNNKSGKITYAGYEATETTIVRTGGATDGSTPLSRKIVTYGNSTKIFPFKAIPLTAWNEKTGTSVTATIYGIWGGASLPTTDDIWVDVEYEGATTSPKSTFINTGTALLGSSAPWSSDTSTWSGSTTPFRMTVTFTPQKKGPIYFGIRCAKTSTTFYIDPAVVVV